MRVLCFSGYTVTKSWCKDDHPAESGSSWNTGGLPSTWVCPAGRPPTPGGCGQSGQLTVVPSFACLPASPARHPEQFVKANKPIPRRGLLSPPTCLLSRRWPATLPSCLPQSRDSLLSSFFFILPGIFQFFGPLFRLPYRPACYLHVGFVGSLPSTWSPCRPEPAGMERPGADDKECSSKFRPEGGPPPDEQVREFQRRSEIPWNEGV